MKMSALGRYEARRNALAKYWKLWYNEYVLELRALTKHYMKQNNLKVGDYANITGSMDIGNDLVVSDKIKADIYLSGDDSMGITNTTGFEVCLDGVGAKCPGGWCVLQIKDGLITGCI